MATELQTLLAQVGVKRERVRQIDSELATIAIQRDALLAAPLRFEDFRSVLRNALQKVASKSPAGSVVGSCLSPSYGTPPRQIPWKVWVEMEAVGAQHLEFMAHLARVDALTLMSWVFPAQLEEKIWEVLQERVAGRWGNEDQFTIGERESKLAELAVLEESLSQERTTLVTGLAATDKAMGLGE